MSTATITVIAALVSALAAIASAVMSGFNIAITKGQRDYELVQKAHEEERKEIYRKLNSFYGPVRHLLATNGLLYQQFRKGKSPDYSVLLALLEGIKYTGNDHALIEQILEINAKIEDLVISQSGLIDSDELKNMLTQAGTHYHLIRMAEKALLTGDIEEYRKHVYPYQLIDLVEREIKRLKSRLDVLNEGKLVDIVGPSK